MWSKTLHRLRFKISSFKPKFSKKPLLKILKLVLFRLESHTLEKSQTLEARNSEIDLLKKRVNLLKEDNNKLKADIERCDYVPLI